MINPRLVPEHYIEGALKRSQSLLENSIKILTQKKNLDHDLINYVSEVSSFCGYISALNKNHDKNGN